MKRLLRKLRKEINKVDKNLARYLDDICKQATTKR